jgi:hypothetical protein
MKRDSVRKIREIRAGKLGTSLEGTFFGSCEGNMRGKSMKLGNEVMREDGKP